MHGLHAFTTAICANEAEIWFQISALAAGFEPRTSQSNGRQRHRTPKDPAIERVISGPRSRLKNTRNLLLNDGDFMNEFKLH